MSESKSMRRNLHPAIFESASDFDPTNRLMMSWRRVLLGEVDKVERMIGLSPRTAELRRWWKAEES